MVDPVNLIVGLGIVVLNIIPFAIKKPRYLLVTSIVSLLILFLLTVVR